MAILKYVPPVAKILDKRNSSSGYYIATCECCGTEFYPSRSNGRYCTANCRVYSHRTAIASVAAAKDADTKPIIPKDNVTSVKSWDVIVNSRADVIDLLSSNEVKTHGLLKRLIALKSGEHLVWQGYKIARLSVARYGVETSAVGG